MPAIGGWLEVLEGTDRFHRFVVIAFPTFERGVTCYGSLEYTAIAALRQNGAGEVETIMVESGDATLR
jgi:uncharacterized protein (DUF1330 family)